MLRKLSLSLSLSLLKIEIQIKIKKKILCLCYVKSLSLSLSLSVSFTDGLQYSTSNQFHRSYHSQNDRCFVVCLFVCLFVCLYPPPTAVPIHIVRKYDRVASSMTSGLIPAEFSAWVCLWYLVDHRILFLYINYYGSA